MSQTPDNARKEYVQATAPVTVIDEADEIIAIPGMGVSTPDWRRIVKELLYTITLLRKIAAIKAATNANAGWLPFVSGETNLVDGRAYWVLAYIAHGPDKGKYIPDIAVFSANREVRIGFANYVLSPGFAQRESRKPVTYTMYQEIRFPPDKLSEDQK